MSSYIGQTQALYYLKPVRRAPYPEIDQETKNKYDYYFEIVAVQKYDDVTEMWYEEDEYVVHLTPKVDHTRLSWWRFWTW